MKAIQVFKPTNDVHGIIRLDMSTPGLLVVTDTIESNRITDPAASAWHTWGFARPAVFGDCGFKTFPELGLVVLCVSKRERILPAKVIQQHTNVEVARLEQAEGRKLGRREYKEVKERVTSSLLPSSHIKETPFLVYLGKDHLIIETSSAKVAEDIITFMRNAFTEDFGTLGYSLWYPEKLSVWFGAMVSFAASSQHQVSVNDLEVTGKVITFDGTPAARFKNVDMTSEPITDLLVNGETTITELGLDLLTERDGEMLPVLSFVLNNKGAIKGMKHSDFVVAEANHVVETGDDPIELFDMAVTLNYSTARKLIAALDEATATDDGEL